MDTVQDSSGIIRRAGIDVGELFTYGVRGDLNGQGLYGIYAFGAQIESKVVYAVFVFVRCEAFVRSNGIFACGAALCGRGAEGNRQRIGTGYLADKGVPRLHDVGTVSGVDFSGKAKAVVYGRRYERSAEIDLRVTGEYSYRQGYDTE